MGKITVRIIESELILPSLFIINKKSDEKINTSELIKELRKLLNPGIEDTKILEGRKDDKFSQKVRNLRAHRTLEKDNYTKYKDGYFYITEKGKDYLLKNQKELNKIVENETFLDQINSPILNYYAAFCENIDNINVLLNLDVGDKTQYYMNLLFSSIITILETYLYDALKFNIFNDESDVYLQKFIETFAKYKDEPYFYCDIYKEFSEKENKIEKEISRLSYHRLDDIELIYKGVFSINFPDKKYLKKKIFIRHDLVHKNGKKSNGQLHKIEKKEVLELCNNTKEFIENIEAQFKKINK